MKGNEMALLFANENGDWWGADDNNTSTIFTLDTDKLTATEIAEIEAEWGYTIDDILENNADKVERIIQKYGVAHALPAE